MEIRRVGVAGLGTMGAGIAQVCIQAGFETIGREVSEELCERARKTIGHYLARGVEKGRLSTGERDAALARLALTTDLAELAGCDLVIEAIAEELEPKCSLFAELSELAPDAILATNTSALSVTELFNAAARPERVVGMHFFNRRRCCRWSKSCARSSSTTTSTRAAYALAVALGKEPIRCHDSALAGAPGAADGPSPASRRDGGRGAARPEDRPRLPCLRPLGGDVRGTS
jgi:3-hydroxybutyryl-CoA dehydrogenase